MEEKNLTEAQVAEQTPSQDTNKVESELDVILNENEQLKAQNTDLIQKLKATEQSLDWNRRQYIEFMNQRDILKNALEEVCKRQKVSEAEMYEVIMTANDIDFDTVISKLGKNL